MCVCVYTAQQITVRLTNDPENDEDGHLKPLVRVLGLCWEVAKVDDPIIGEVPGVAVEGGEDHIEGEGSSHGGKELRVRREVESTRVWGE